MPDKTIGNPLSWSAQRLAGMGRGLGHAIDGIGRHQTARPQVNRIGLADLRAALRDGARDFAALRSDVIFLVVLYPVIGFILGIWVLNAGQVQQAQCAACRAGQAAFLALDGDAGVVGDLLPAAG